MKRLTDTEAKTLYSRLLTSIDPRDVFLQLLFETGARVSETLTLSSTDLVGRSLGVAPLKNSSPRLITISANLAAKLARLPPTRWSDALTGAEAALPSRRRGLDRHFRAAMSALGQRPINLHALRHTAFSRLYEQTHDLILVKQWAGHRSINSTLVYMTIDAQDQANRAVDEGLKALAHGAE